MSKTSIEPARPSAPPEMEANPFADIDAKWERWYRETHLADHPDRVHVKPGIDPTVEGLEKELWIKACLLTEGLRFDPLALEGVSEIYREQSRWLFDWNHGEHSYYLPEELVLPMDTIVQVRENRDSRWQCTVEDGVLVLKRDGKTVSEARHIPRPAYYGKEASEGIIMRRVAPKRGQDCLVLNYSPFCMYWATDDGCDFCNIVPNMKWTKDDLQMTRRSYDQIVATTRASFDEGCVRHILLTGGFLKREVRDNGQVIDREGDRIMTVIRAMQEALQRHDIPVNVIRTAPEDLDTIAEHKAQGVHSVAYNLELWEPLLFERYCRGKNGIQGRDHWLKALELAVDVYGPGKVSTHWVAGFRETADSLLEGVEWMSERGIGSIPLVWSPVEGTPYAGERSPGAEWYLDVTRKIAAIRLKYGADTFQPAALPNDCHWCAMPSLVADELRLQRLIREQAKPADAASPVHH
ncbi:MAG: radical SAM protein [bacterium]